MASPKNAKAHVIRKRATDSFPNKNLDYRLIWFHHFEKAAGSTVVQLARTNGEKLFPNETNACPRSGVGELINLWDYNSDQLLDFVNFCEKNRITFVSTSFGAPDFEILAGDDRVCLLTTIRDPIDRYISHFRYDYFRGGPYRNIIDFRASGNTTMYSFPKLDNYYCRVLSRNWLCSDLPPDAYYKASKNLLLFDLFAIVDDSSWVNYICNLFNWAHCDLHINQSNLSINHLMSLLKNRKFDLLYRHLFIPPHEPDADFRKEFAIVNRKDLMLYDMAQRVYEERCRR